MAESTKDSPPAPAFAAASPEIAPVGRADPAVAGTAGPLPADATSAARPFSAKGAVADAAAALPPVETTEAAGPDQILAENQYRLAVGLAAKRFRRYPPVARERGWEGAAELWLAFGPPSAVPSVSLAKASGHAVLDRAAVSLVTDAIRAVPVPPQLLERRARIRLVIEYRLDER